MITHINIIHMLYIFIIRITMYIRIIYRILYMYIIYQERLVMLVK